jgi:hypothetical protein
MTAIPAFSETAFGYTAWYVYVDTTTWSLREPA